MNPGEAVKMDSEYKSFLAELGGNPPPDTSDVGGRGGHARQFAATACSLVGIQSGFFPSARHPLLSRSAACAPPFATCPIFAVCLQACMVVCGQATSCQTAASCM